MCPGSLWEWSLEAVQCLIMKSTAWLQGSSAQNPPDSNPSGEVKSSGNSFPLPTIHCYREISRGSPPGNGTSSRERAQDVLRGRTVLYCLAVYSANSSKPGLGGQKEKISNFLLVRMQRLFAIDVYVTGVQSSKKNSEILSLFSF